MTQLLGADSITPTALPGNAEWVAGYVGGHWPDYANLVAIYPQLAAQNKVVPVAVNAGERARILDVETGDATPEQAGPWLKDMLANGVPLPGVYADESNMPGVLASVRIAKVDRKKIVLWLAKWDNSAVVPSGFEAKQYASHAAYDLDVAVPAFFPATPGPPHQNIVHYNWFRPVRIWGILYHEGAIAHTYDKLRIQKNPSLATQLRLKLLKAKCKRLGMRLDSVIADRPKPESQKDHRFYRRAQLYARAAGHRLV